MAFPAYVDHDLQEVLRLAEESSRRAGCTFIDGAHVLHVMLTTDCAAKVTAEHAGVLFASVIARIEPLIAQNGEEQPSPLDLSPSLVSLLSTCASGADTEQIGSEDLLVTMARTDGDIGAVLLGPSQVNHEKLLQERDLAKAAKVVKSGLVDLDEKTYKNTEDALERGAMTASKALAGALETQLEETITAARSREMEIHAQLRLLRNRVNAVDGNDGGGGSKSGEGSEFVPLRVIQDGAQLRSALHLIAEIEQDIHQLIESGNLADEDAAILDELLSRLGELRDLIKAVGNSDEHRTLLLERAKRAGASLSGALVWGCSSLTSLLAVTTAAGATSTSALAIIQFMNTRQPDVEHLLELCLLK